MMIDQRRGKVEEESLACEKCGNTWMEQIHVFQYKKYHNLILGQNVPPTQDVSFPLLRCVNCGKVTVPSVEPGRTDRVYRLWKNMLNALGEESGEGPDAFPVKR
jgi:hypothetical protein